MQIHYILSVTSNDKPGVVEAISSAVESCEASWLESHLAHLCGKFVGVIRIRTDQSKATLLEQKLSELSEDGIHISLEALAEASNKISLVNAKFTAVGPDRVGIIKEISSAFSSHQINVEELESTLSSMPYSGEPIFEAQGLLSLPADFELRVLHEAMDSIANDLGLDLDIEQI
ncbi:glycine cleavage system protein R [Agaribacterium sp. ZY112]|uniref:glycine cleavage system protein R n=1 Tax=Agaribacterium sp. ZY112 TaxID=3233574 RepID=UPI003525FD75